MTSLRSTDIIEGEKLDKEKRLHGKNAEVGTNFNITAFNANIKLKHEAFRFRARSEFFRLCLYVNNAIIGHLRKL